MLPFLPQATDRFRTVTALSADCRRTYWRGRHKRSAVCTTTKSLRCFHLKLLSPVVCIPSSSVFESHSNSGEHSPTACQAVIATAAVEDLTHVLDVPREDFNITTMSGKGRVAGTVSIYNPKHGRWLDCSKEVYSVSGDLHELRCSSNPPCIASL